MIRSSFLQLLLISVVILIMAGLGYAGWKFIGKKEMESEPTLITLPTLEETDKPEEEKLEISEIDTNDWKTYRNEEYGLEFKYPSKFSVTFNHFNKVMKLISVEGVSYLYSPGIFITKNTQQLTLEDMIKKCEEEPNSYVIESEITIGNENIFLCNPTEALGGLDGIVVTNKYIYSFTHFNFWPKNKILDTIKFLSK